jgi:hypothetical protein
VKIVDDEEETKFNMIKKIHSLSIGDKEEDEEER